VGTPIAPRKEGASRPAAGPDAPRAQILDLPKKLSRRVWIGLAVALAVGVFGLIALTGAVSLILWANRGKSGEKNRD
jgi:hypothetical protein